MSYNPLYVDIHVLQTVPPSCINRDDTGSPKTARFGGVRRARVSSQAWKKATRDEFANLLNDDEVGYRTKNVVELVAQQIIQCRQDIDEAEAKKLAESVMKMTGIKLKDGLSGYLLFIAARQVDALAQLAIRSYESGEKIIAKEARSILNVKERPTLNAIDVALFGRMVADKPELNVDAAVQVAHALGVSATETEFDYFTAMDDLLPEDQSGAGMIGTVEFLSDTLYRYATVDVRHLCENLGSVSVTAKAIEAFVRAFVCSMPTGKQNTFANRTLPDAIVVQLRNTQPVSLVGAFERPVFAGGNKSVSEVACERLAAQTAAIDQAFGIEPGQTFILCGTPGSKDGLSAMEGERLGINDLVSRTAEVVSTFLQECDLAQEC